MSYFICGEKTAEYLQQLIYEADLEAYKKIKRKRKRKKKYESCINLCWKK